jgi:uncharacterized protein YecE (DUF72 family)
MEQQYFYSGTSNIVLPVPNKTLFPPEFQEKSRLEYYASLFNSLEVNSSFYKVPMATTVAKWAASVPDGFQLTFKLWRDITHNKELAFNPADVGRFMQVIDGAGDKKGCLLVQLPPKTTVAYRNQLERLLICLRQNDPGYSWKIAIEFRNRDWYREDIYELLDKYQMGMVMHDMPKSATPLRDDERDFVFLRFHGPESNYRGSYNDDFLAEYASYIQSWQSEGKTVYAYFNNTLGNALQNLITLNIMINS